MNAHASTATSNSHTPSTWRITIGYSVMLVVAIGLFFLIRMYGEQLTPAHAAVVRPENAAHAARHIDILYHVLIALIAIILLGRWMGKLCVYIGQPRVIGEMIAGIMLGPSLLGWLWPATMNAVLPGWNVPDAMSFILPKEVAPFLAIIAQIGVILYMFLIGLELNAGLLRSRAHATVAISHASIIAPFLLGAILALWLYPKLATADVPFTSFALFMGVAMSITAFPVLARILTDRHMEHTELGVVAISCAAADDVTAWCLLAFVVGIANAAVGDAIETIIWAMVYITFMFLVVRPLAVRYLASDARKKQPNRRMAVWVLVCLLISAATAEWIGIHAIFGAFLLGAIIPHDADIAVDFRNKLEDIVKILLLPAFFALTGMRTKIGLVSGWEAWMFCAVIILVATLGKFGGTLIASRCTGLSWRMSAALGILMNTRGLMELIVLNIGLEMGVISEKLFAMMVIMALVTTIATTPILHFLTSARPDAT